MELLHQELSGKIIACAYKVYNTLGFGFQEKEYQSALVSELDLLGLKYREQVYSDLIYLGKKLRGYFLDIIVENTIVVELKVANKPYQRHFFQINQYLRNNNFQLGLIIVFSPTGVIVKRVVNLT